MEEPDLPAGGGGLVPEDVIDIPRVEGTDRPEGKHFRKWLNFSHRHTASDRSSSPEHPGVSDEGSDSDRPSVSDEDTVSDGLDAILEELDQVVDPVTEAVGMSPAMGIAVAGGPMITLTEEERATEGAPPGDSVKSGLSQAGPVAVAGLVVNGTAALVVVAVARLVSSQAYGAIAQLLGLFFILSMPGSAVLVGVVRRVTALRKAGRPELVRRWITRVHRIVLIGIAVELIVVVALQGWIAKQLSLPNSDGIVLILVAAGVWILLCVDRGLLQAHRSYRLLAGNLLLEGSVRTCFVLVLVAGHLGVAGYALGVFISEVGATVHAHWLASKAWSAAGATVSAAPAVAPATEVSATWPTPVGPTPTGPTAAVTTEPSRVASEEPPLVRRRLMADVSAAFVGLGLLGLLQNVDVILLGRLDHANVGSYAAISVASKALVFGALALGAYLLPEATIRWNEGGHAIRQLGVTLIFLAVPAALLLVISVIVPKQFLTLVFGAKLSTAAPAFATLVVAMMFLSVSVLITNYLFGTGSRWIVLLLAGGSGLAAGVIAAADGHIMATARADMVVQGVLAMAMVVAFVAIHHRHGRHRLPFPRQRPARTAAMAAMDHEEQVTG